MSGGDAPRAGLIELAEASHGPESSRDRGLMPDSADSLMPVLDAGAMREADRRAIEEAGIQGRVLMEAAGRAVAEAVVERCGSADRITAVVLCGTGNNGGDGYVAARLLHERGARVRVLASGKPRTPDAKENLRALEKRMDHRLSVEVAENVRRLARLRPTVVIDALLGTGQGAPGEESNRWLREPIRALCAWANRQSAPIVAVDISTGLDASTGTADPDAIRAVATVTLGALKPGLLIAQGPSLAGVVTVADIGIPPEHLVDGAVAWRATDAWVARRLPPRPADAHKYNVGRVLAIAGSRALTGAAALATGAAYRAGAGAVVCCTPRTAQPIVDMLRPEVMVAPQFESEEGTLGIAAYDEIVDRMQNADAILMGCGLGRPAETQRLVRALLRRAYAPTVLDADGLNAFEGQPEKLKDVHAPLVLTPHTGELARLLGSEPPADRIAAVRDLSNRWNAVIVLKGMPSVVGSPDGRVFIGPPPAPSLATAGTGDVLAGTIVGLLARGMEPLDAAVAALHIGTAAAERFERVRGPGLMAGDLLHEMPSVMSERFAGA